MTKSQRRTCTYAQVSMELAFAIVFLCFAVSASTLQDSKSPIAYDERVVDGVVSYSDEIWADSVLHFRQAIDDYNRLVRARIKCFTKCNQENSAPRGFHPLDDEDLRLFYHVVHRSACIEQCMEEYVDARIFGGVPYSIHERLETRESYNYLQMSLYQNGQVKEGARACATYAYYHPDDLQTKSNLKLYKGEPGVIKDDLEPLELLAYRERYREGQLLYHQHNWEPMVEKFEDGLKEFYPALNECHTLCQGPMRYSRTLDFAQIMSRQFTALQECRMYCIDKLGKFRNDPENFFGSYFHYLQYGYYNLNKSVEAVESSATHLRLEPNSETAKRNAVFYRQQPGITRKDFKPREDVLPLIQSLEENLELIHIVDRLSGFLDHHLDSSQADHDPSAAGNDQALLFEDIENFSSSSTEAVEASLEPAVVQFGEELKGEERVVVDQLMSKEQCEALIELAVTHAIEGDGYGQKSPHTKSEKFEGLHILVAAKGTAEGNINRTQSQLYIDASYMVKDMVSQHFNLQQPLYFSYTHLVCRTAKEGSQDNREDLSHPVHSDNCILDDITGECNKVPPAYTWRDYSGLMYLNEEFEGGKFFFAHSTHNLTPEVFVSPKCGRMVGFSAGKENMHGVTAVTKGRRCAVALWFTLDPEHREPTFDEAEDILSALKTNHNS